MKVASPIYVSTVATLYALTFVAIFLIVGEWPPVGVGEAVLMTAAASTIMAWGPSLRISQMWPDEKAAFRAASLMHGTVIGFMLILAVFTKLQLFET